jgi:hypothetical protein
VLLLAETLIIIQRIATPSPTFPAEYPTILAEFYRITVYARSSTAGFMGRTHHHSLLFCMAA